MLDDRGEEIENLKEYLNKIQNKTQESQQIKDEKIKLESNLEERNKEIIELKKKIKLMRRDMQKS